MNGFTIVVLSMVSSLITQTEYSSLKNWLWTAILVAGFGWLSVLWRRHSNKVQEKPPQNQKTSTEDSKQHLDQLRKSIEDAIKRGYGIENLEPLMVKKLIAIGEVAYKCYATLKQSQNKNGYALGLVSENETAEEWFKRFPKRIETVANSIIEKNSKIARLDKESELLKKEVDLIKAALIKHESEQKERENKIIQLRAEIDNLQKQRDGFQSKTKELQAELNLRGKELQKKQEEINDLYSNLNDRKNEIDRLLRERDNLQRKIAALRDELTSTEKELEKKDAEILKLQTKLKERDEKIINLQNEIEDLKKRLEELEHLARKMSGIKLIKSSIPYLRQGQRNFLEGSKETGSAAVLCFLVTYSLLQIYRAIFDENEIDETKRNAMLVNLYLITRKLEKTPGFKGASEELMKNFSNINSLEEMLVHSEERHFDDRLFRVLLKYIYDYSHVDLTPFYFDNDENGKVYCVN
ncbi:hypothetical protein L0337_24895 [candidate division KSB1 bacterium]|nr:hypothetical protein [candidate division KSB1 bacterium]